MSASVDTPSTNNQADSFSAQSTPSTLTASQPHTQEHDKARAISCVQILANVHAAAQQLRNTVDATLMHV